MPTPDSSCFFSNKSCRFYPCHRGVDELNCMFCYCPMYYKEHCPGTPKFKEKDGRVIKVCTECVFPHKAENYGLISDILKQMSYPWSNRECNSKKKTIF